MSIYATSTLPSGIQVYANATLFPVVGFKGQQAVDASTNTIYIYDTSAPAGWKAVANPGAATAIDALIGDVTATGPGVVASTVAKIQGNAVSGTTGTVNVVFSDSPTFTTGITLSSLTANQILASSSGQGIISLTTATYPSLTELSYVKGVTSSVQTQLNNKQPTGSYITALTGDVTAAGPGSVTATIANAAVTGTKIATNTVANSNLALMVNNTIKGNVSGGSASPSDLSSAQVTAFLSSFTSSLQGVVPASGGGTTNFLRADGTWATAGTTLPSQTSNADKVLTTDGTNLSWQFAGLGANDFGTGNVVLGRGSISGIGTNCVVIGTDATSGSGYNNAVVIGKGAYAYNDAISIGYNAHAQDQGGGYCTNIAIGSGSTATQNAAIAIGYQATAYQSSIALGRGASVSALGGGISIGSYATSSSSGNNISGIAIGYYAAAGSGQKTTIIGHASGNSSASGASNTVVGTGSFNSGSLTSAYNNTVIGQGSGTALTTGYNNTVIGQGSGTALTTGDDNVIIGLATANKINSGYYNTIVGNGAGANLTNGAFNSFFGYQAGLSTTGQVNTILGLQSDCGSGNYNLIVGYQSGYSTLSGSNNVVLGNQSGQHIGSGSYNVAIGTQAISAGNSNGSGNVAIGYQACDNGGGSYNVAVGHLALNNQYNTSTNGTVAIGAYAGAYQTTTSGEFFVNNQDRSNYSGDQTKSLLYGTFNATASSQTLTTNSQFTATYGVSVSTAGYGLTVKSGSNSKIGVATFSGVSSVTVSTTAVTSNSIILVTNQSGGYAPMCVNNIVAGTSFDIQYNTSFTGTVAWMIVEQS
jgi:hypothetical protein